MVALVRAMTGAFPARPALVLSNRADAGGLAKAAEMGVPTAVVDHRPYGEDRPAFERAMTDVIEAAGADLICPETFPRHLKIEAQLQ